jgi:hypothetical protein
MTAPGKSLPATSDPSTPANLLPVGMQAPGVTGFQPISLT